MIRCTQVHSTRATLCYMEGSDSVFTLIKQYVVTQAAKVLPPNKLVTQSNTFGWLFPKFKDRCVHVAHLEEVILMYHTTVGQVLDQSVGEGGFPSVCYTEWDEAIKRQ